MRYLKKNINNERQELLTRFAKGIKNEDEIQTAGTCWPLLHSTFYFILFFFRIHHWAAGGFRKRMLSPRRNLVWVSIFYGLLEVTQSTENRKLPQTPEPIFCKIRRKTSAATNSRAKAGKAVEIRTRQMGECTREVHMTTEPKRPEFYNGSRHYVTKFKHQWKKHGAEMQLKERRWWAETETSLWSFTNSKIKMEKSIRDVPFKSRSRKNLLSPQCLIYILSENFSCVIVGTHL